MDFQIIFEALVSIIFECKNLSNSFIFYFLPHFAVMPNDFYACLTNCVGVFRETDSLTHKKGSYRRNRHTK
jgi:hypothetical protein